MKKVEYDKKFKVSYKERIKSDKMLQKLFSETVHLFEQNPLDPDLNNHELVGIMKGKRSISVTEDIRIIFFEKSDKYIFLDIGTHKQVYKK